MTIEESKSDTIPAVSIQSRRIRSDIRRQGILSRNTSKSTLVAQLKYRNYVQETQILELKSRLDQVITSLKCSICYETMYAPTTLPCGHSYCMVCLTDYRRISSAPGPGKCPNCRTCFFMSFLMPLLINVHMQDLVIGTKSLEFYEDLGMAQMWQKVIRRPTRIHSTLFVWPESSLDLLYVICFLATLGERDHPNAIVDLDIWKEAQSKFLQILPDCSFTIHRKTDMVLSTTPDQVSIDIYCRLPNFPLVLKASSKTREVPKVTNSDILSMFLISTKY